MLKGKKKYVLIAASCAILVGCAGVYTWKVAAYWERFLPGTMINGIDCSGKTAEEAEQAYREQVEDYKISIAFREDVTETIEGSSFSYSYQDQGEMKRLLEKQNPFLWMKSWVGMEKYEVKTGIVYDKDELKEVVLKLPSLLEENQEEPENAKIVYKEDGFQIKNEKEGTKIIEETLLQALHEAVDLGQETLDADAEDVYEKPEITKENELLKRQEEQLNQLANVCVTYQLPEGEQVLKGSTVRKWLAVDEEGNYYLDEEKLEKKIKKYVKKLAEEVDTAGEDRTFHTTSGLDVTVSGGNYGWKVDQKAERKALKKNITNLDKLSRKPKYSQEELGTENNGLGDTYIEVNLTEQHLYYYQKGNIVVDTPLVSGRMTYDRFTPPGIYFLTYKQKDRILRGQPDATGKPSYESHVNYWMPFNGGIGLHDAAWRSTFGGTIYVYSGSHGCINLPGNKAAQIYERIDKETPIVCVYNDGYQLHG